MIEDKNILLLCGGKGTERDISIQSALFFKEQLRKISQVKTFFVELTPDGQYLGEEKGKAPWEIGHGGLIKRDDCSIKIDFAIPCFHGYPGESGQVQGFFEFMGWPYLGTPSEGSIFSFNKISTKLWMYALGIPYTPFIFLSALTASQLDRAKEFFQTFGEIFIKPSCQGSSLGISLVRKEDELENAIARALEHSPTVLLEKSVRGRELELALYEYEGELQVGGPGEIICPQGFYDYHQKYASDSKSKTVACAQGIDKRILDSLKDYAKRIFTGLGLRHLARMDFFMTEGRKIFFNECNTFPGHTSISMFPMMMEANGHSYDRFLAAIIEKEGT